MFLGKWIKEFFIIINFNVFKLFQFRYVLKLTRSFYVFFTYFLSFFFFFNFFWVLLLPQDLNHGWNYKLMYLHVPSAWASFLIYLCLVFFSILFIVFEDKFYFNLIRPLFLLGLFFCGVSLLTGCFWAKPLWGAYIVFDSRVVSYIFLLFIFLFLVIYDLYFPEYGMRWVSYFIIWNTMLIVFIKYSVDWFNTLHQNSSIDVINNKVFVHDVMFYPLFSSFVFVVCFIFYVWVLDYRSFILKRFVLKYLKKN